MTIKQDVEALLFSSGRALSQDALSSILDTDPKNIRKSLKELKEDYDARDTALKIFQEGEEWKMLVRDAHIPVVQRVVADTEFGRPTLETLAVIAFKNPLLQSEVIEKRGSHAYEHIKELEKAGFITKQPEGRSYKLKLAEKFFEYFDVEGAEDIREVFKNVKEPVPDHIGEMEVVDVEEDKEEENPFMTRELGTKPQLTPQERQEKEKFLDEIDKKLHATSSRNDEHERDVFLKEESQDTEDDSDEKAGSDDNSDDDKEDDDYDSADNKNDSSDDGSESSESLSELPDGSPEDDLEKL